MSIYLDGTYALPYNLLPATSNIHLIPCSIKCSSNNVRPYTPFLSDPSAYRKDHQIFQQIINHTWYILLLP